MLSDRAELTERLFHEASELPVAARAEFLAGACADDPDLASRLDRLLKAAGEVEQRAAWRDPAVVNEARPMILQADSVGLGRYRLLEPIGAGGMGVVYRAVRADDVFSKQVAIKIVHAASGRSEIRRRFLQERQILANLDHPNIARLLDGGETGEGSPFLVMEYVEGIPLDRYVAENNIGVGKTLALFREICAAVSCAHRNLVVHRDLKPANILVTAGGQPKLLDFGIARLLDGSGSQTRTGAGAMTPEYASPEQILGGPITTVTDVYALGVLLYEMLSGAHPYGAPLSSLDLAHAIVAGEIQPMRCGGRLADEDLENIVRKAMRREPERRYASVEQLSEDVRRHLDGYPVSARPDSRLYRLRKFAARNRLALAAAALVIAAAGAGTMATIRQAGIANRQAAIATRRFKDVRKLANAYLFEFHDAIQNLPGSTPARQLVVKRALEYLDSLFAERVGEPGLARELAGAYARIGEIQGRPVQASLGDRPGGMLSYGKAIALLEPVVSRGAIGKADPDVVRELIMDYANFGTIATVSGSIAEAARAERKAVALGEKLMAAHSSDPQVMEALAYSLIVLGDVTGNPSWENLGDTETAAGLYRRGADIRGRIAAADQTNIWKQIMVTVATSRIGQIMRATGDLRGAADIDRKVRDASEHVLETQPLNVGYQWDAAMTNRNLAVSLLRVKEMGEARRAGERGLALFQEMARADPHNLAAWGGEGDALLALGDVLAAQGDSRGAMRYYNLALVSQRTAARPAGERNTWRSIAELALSMKDTARAMEAARRQLSDDEQMLRADRSNIAATRNQGVAWRQMGRALELRAQGRDTAKGKLADLSEARVWYGKSLDVLHAGKAGGKLSPQFATELLETQRDVARCEGAMAELTRAELAKPGLVQLR